MQHSKGWARGLGGSYYSRAWAAVTTWIEEQMSECGSEEQPHIAVDCCVLEAAQVAQIGKGGRLLEMTNECLKHFIVDRAISFVLATEDSNSARIKFESSPLFGEWHTFEALPGCQNSITHKIITSVGIRSLVLSDLPEHKARRRYRQGFQLFLPMNPGVST